MSNLEESKLIKLADSIVKWHTEQKEQEYSRLDAFSNEVREIERLFYENNIPAFSYTFPTDDDHGSHITLMWDNPHFVYVWEGEPTILLGASASIRKICMSQFEEFLGLRHQVESFLLSE